MSYTIVGINATNFGCTGRINIGIMDIARKRGFNTYTVCKYANSTKNLKLDNQIFVTGVLRRNIRAKLEYLTGYQLIGGYFSTRKLIKQLDKLKPDLLHFHIMHTSYINIKCLIDYANRKKIPIVWTMHDCWAITGQCPYFDEAHCEKWKTGCYNCPQLKRYPSSRWFDRSNVNYLKKKQVFTSAQNMYIVCPSEWLSNIMRASFLKHYPIYTIYNGVDQKSFHPRKSDFREKYEFNDKFIILGIAGSWEKRKGIDYFIKLAEDLTEEYQIVLIGVNTALKETLPKNIFTIAKTENLTELAAWYTVADVLVNPTLEDNFPTVNIESLSCGTPVITFNTGGSPEAINDKTGIVVSKGDYEGLKRAIESLRYSKADLKQQCIRRSTLFSEEVAFNKYCDLYEKILEKQTNI